MKEHNLQAIKVAMFGKVLTVEDAETRGQFEPHAYPVSGDYLPKGQSSVSVWDVIGKVGMS